MSTCPALTTSRASRRGFSIIELIVAVIIIGILVMIIVPRLSDRSEQAKIARANTDLEIIQSALERCVIDFSFMVRLHVLDDVAGGDGLANTIADNNDDIIDGFSDEDLQTGFGVHPHLFNAGANTHQLFFDPATGLMLGTAASQALFDRLETGTAWKGPYLTYQLDVNSDVQRRTFIGDDPFGNDYLIFTDEGMIDEDPNSATNGQIITSVLIGSITYDCQVFDRTTVLSLGPNGVPGDGTAANGFGEGDDLSRSF